MKQKKRNVYNGDEEEDEELVNLDEDELESFNNDYVAKSRDFRQKYQSIGAGNQTGRQRLALTNGPSSSQAASYPAQVPSYPQQVLQQVPSYPPQATTSHPLYYNLAQEQDTRPPSRGKSKVKFEQTVDKKAKKSKSKKPY